MQLCFASHNLNKVNELKALVGSNIDILSLDDLGVKEEIPETGKTLEENALQKAKFVVDTFSVDCFADDTGLEVKALGGAPGVYSARYAGEPANSERNMAKLLDALSGIDQREAKFRTVIALIQKNEVFSFEGVVEGEIAKNLSGVQGFGYDPLFIPKGFNRTFAEMSLEEKNKISHRGRAVEKLIEFLTKT
jgi:XTP/dITP diphosphohydrolase